MRGSRPPTLICQKPLFTSQTREASSLKKAIDLRGDTARGKVWSRKRVDQGENLEAGETAELKRAVAKSKIPCPSWEIQKPRGYTKPITHVKTAHYSLCLFMELYFNMSTIFP
jgi:hypothetical protein